MVYKIKVIQFLIGEKFIPETTSTGPAKSPGITVWGCFTGTGIRELRLCQDIVDTEEYLKILNEVYS